LIVVDFEASAPVGGYPVSVSIAGSDRRLYFRVIAPHEEWRTLKWDERSEQIHKKTREFVSREGALPALIVAELNEMFTGEVIVSDNPLRQDRLLQRLVVAAGVRPSFAFSPINAASILKNAFSARKTTAGAQAIIEREIGRLRTQSALSGAAAWCAGLEAAMAWMPKAREGNLEAIFQEWSRRISDYLAGLEAFERPEPARRDLARRPD
jgi:hypothetical protein